MSLFAEVTAGVFIFVISILFHEFGHWACLRIMGRKPRIRFYYYAIMVGVQKDYDGLKPWVKFAIYFVGVLLGLVPIVFWLLFSVWGLVLLVVYLYGSLNDFKKMWRLFRWCGRFGWS